MHTLLKNGHLISPQFELRDAALLLCDDRVEAVLPAGSSLPDADTVVDLNSQMVVPGFVDIHCHGRDGADFCDGTVAAFRTIARGKLSEGVTGFLATTLTLGRAQLEATARAAAEYGRHPTGARLLGIHLEGPFINPECVGAQNPAFCALPDIDLVARLSQIHPVKIVSLSPELPGATAFMKDLVARGIMPSGAHSAADYAQFQAAREAGMKHLTHFCNVMTPLHHLRFGMVGGAFLSPDVSVEIIVDGMHLCPEMIKLIFMLKTVDRVMLITDAMRAAGMPDGDYDLGGLQAHVCHGKAQLDNGAVAGSTLQMHQALRRVHEITGLPLTELVATTAWNQARSLNLPGLGKLEAGYQADLVVLDDALNPVQVWVDGQRR